MRRAGLDSAVVVVGTPDYGEIAADRDRLHATETRPDLAIGGEEFLFEVPKVGCGIAAIDMRRATGEHGAIIAVG